MFVDPHEDERVDVGVLYHLYHASALGRVPEGKARSPGENLYGIL